MTKIRTYDLCFFDKEDLIKFVTVVYMTNRKLSVQLDISKPRLLRFYIFKLKFRWIAESYGFRLPSLLLVRILIK